MGRFDYCPGHPSNDISSGALKIYTGFQKFESEPLEHCESVDPQGSYWISPYQTHNNLNYLQIEIFKVNPHRYRNFVVPNVCEIYKTIPLSLFISVWVIYLLPY